MVVVGCRAADVAAWVEAPSLGLDLGKRRDLAQARNIDVPLFDKVLREHRRGTRGFFDDLAADLQFGRARVGSRVGHDKTGPTVLVECRPEELDPQVVAVVGFGDAEGVALVTFDPARSLPRAAPRWRRA